MIPAGAVEAAGYNPCAPDPHHWISTNVPGLLARWVIQCSLCGAYNVTEMNAALEAAAPHLMAAAWDEGYVQADYDAPHSIKTDNPYRKSPDA